MKVMEVATVMDYIINSVKFSSVVLTLMGSVYIKQ